MPVVNRARTDIEDVKEFKETAPVPTIPPQRRTDYRFFIFANVVAILAWYICVLFYRIRRNGAESVPDKEAVESP